MQTNLTGSFQSSPKPPRSEAEQDRIDAIAEAMSDALTDGDGHPRPDALTRHLAKFGLIIVDASKYGAAKAALQVIGSGDTYANARETAAALGIAVSVAQVALKRMEG